MAVIGLDDTDSRTAGMCTTWLGTEVAARLPANDVEAMYLVRLNPAIEHKTRGNGAVAVHATCELDTLIECARSVVEEYAVHSDPHTNPGVVGIPTISHVPVEVSDFARDAVRSRHSIDAARSLVDAGGLSATSWGNGRGLIGALAAIGAVACRVGVKPSEPVFGDWTYEWLTYRERDRWGTPREVEVDPATDTLRTWSPLVWDTVDRVTGASVCAPHSPCPVLYGIRGDRPVAVRAVGAAIDSEPAARTQLFVTNQGSDGHLRPGTIGALEDGCAYRLSGRVTAAPTTRRGGHVAFGLGASGGRIRCLAFAPTGRFRDHVHDLVPGDRLIACGEVDSGALKLEKFALVERVLTAREVPSCPDCERSMKSAGRDQGYRCRPCGTDAPGKVIVPRHRKLAPGWYEVPPDARRHLAKPVVRGAYELPVHPTSV